MSTHCDFGPWSGVLEGDDLGEFSDYWKVDQVFHRHYLATRGCRLVGGSMTTTPPAKRFVLKKPPIVEVVCGVQFPPLDLDPLVLGVYWDRRKDEFPERMLQPAITDSTGIILGNAPMRVVLVGADKVHILQVQRDRFFMNWRAVGEQYPRFSNREGQGGLLSLAMAEFAKLTDFCESRFHKLPEPARIELAKIDMIDKERFWPDLDDPAVIVPVTGIFRQVHSGGNREFALRFVEHGTKNLTVSVSSVAERSGGPLTAVRVETRVVAPVEGDSIEECFAKANARTNEAFFKLISEAELARFGAIEEAK